MLDKLFGWGKKKPETISNPEISFGRYSDNNKPIAKVARWTAADNFFKEKKYTDSLDAFFEYLRDDAMQAAAFSVLRKPVTRRILVSTVACAVETAYDDSELTQRMLCG